MTHAGCAWQNTCRSGWLVGTPKAVAYGPCRSVGSRGQDASINPGYDTVSCRWLDYLSILCAHLYTVSANLTLV